MQRRETFDLESFRTSATARYLIFNAAAGWCSPCKTEAVEFQERVVPKYRPRGVAFLSVILQDTARRPATDADVDTWISAFRITFPTVRDPAGFVNTIFNPDSMPLNMIIDLKTMKILEKIVGADVPRVEATLDKLLGAQSLFDNSCTTGGRGRIDIKATKAYTLFGSVGRFANWQLKCGADPSFGLYDKLPGSELERHDITDLYTGFDLRADDGSYITLMMGTRRETTGATGDHYYREGWFQANGSKVVSGPYSIEVDMWHRNRFLNNEQWREGQSYVSLKYKSRGAVVFGHEYSTRPSQINKAADKGSDILRVLRFLPNNPDGDEDNDVQHFLNVGGQVKFGDDVILRFLFGEQRAALKCVSGVCRFFPAFAGFRSELVVRY